MVTLISWTLVPSSSLAHHREIKMLNDTFDAEASQMIEESIRQQAVMENMEHALEHNPASFTKVSTL